MSELTLKQQKEAIEKQLQNRKLSYDERIKLVNKSRALYSLMRVNLPVDFI